MSNAPHGPFPLRLRIVTGSSVRELRVDRPQDLVALRESCRVTGLRAVQVTNLAPLAWPHAVILERDRTVRALIEAETGPSRNSYLTPRLGQMELCLTFNGGLPAGDPTERDR